MSGLPRTILLATTIAMILASPGWARQDGEMFQSRTVKVAGTEYRFRVFTPKGWSKNKKWPMLLFLHGAGERGDDNLAQTRVGIGPAIQRQRETFPFVAVLPQCPRDRWWTEPEMLAQALKALDQTAKELNGDSKRTYLTGLSMGGYGSWVMAAKNPRRFAALAVVCGGVVPPPRLALPEAARALWGTDDPYAVVAKKVGKTPVWLFHGDADAAVPVAESRKMMEALKAAGGRVRYNEYPGVGHNSWDKAYAEGELFSWLLSQRKK
ncbi:MAG TPA: alpha/beta fold hydrolase [Blastocatellia bacterium]|nr:alpha/beta fold hydrolase [Blastocatellia bacterium]